MRNFIVRERTPRLVMLYAVYLYLLGLSYRCVEGALRPFAQRSHVAVWKWVQRLGSRCRSLFTARSRFAVVDETQIWIGGEAWWLWIAIDPARRAILAMRISAHRNSLVAWIFLRTLKTRCGVRRIATDGALFYPWAASRLRLRHSSSTGLERSRVERAIGAVKDRLRAFDVHFPCRCEDKEHVRRFLALYRVWYNHARTHMTLEAPPIPTTSPDEFRRLKNTMEVIALS